MVEKPSIPAATTAGIMHLRKKLRIRIPLVNRPFNPPNTEVLSVEQADFGSTISTSNGSEYCRRACCWGCSVSWQADGGAKVIPAGTRATIGQTQFLLATA